MADLVVTANSVVQTDGQTLDGTAGTTITAGQTVYLNTSTNRYLLAQADGTADEATLKGIALNGAANGQPIRVQSSGRINPGATVTVGQIYAVSATAGGIAPFADLVSMNRVSLLGVGTTAAEITLAINNTGVVKP